MEVVHLERLPAMASFSKTTKLCEEATKRGIACSHYIFECLVIASPGDSADDLYAAMQQSRDEARTPHTVQLSHPYGEV